jgi:hypothetical protein
LFIVPPQVRQLRSCYVKLWRSWEHIQALDSHIARWKFGGGFTITHDALPDGRIDFRIRYGELPAEWSLLIGDAFHNMRSALDHLVYGLTELALDRELTDQEARRTEYPIFGETALDDKARERRIGYLAPHVQDTIVKLQPHLLGDKFDRHTLWTLHQYDNFDKHRTIGTSVMSFEAIGPMLPVVNAVDFALPRQPLKDGQSILTSTPAHPEANLDDVVAILTVAFADGPGKGFDVVRVLRDVHSFVRTIHLDLAQRAGYAIPFPGSNAPVEVQLYDEDEAAPS